MNIINKVNSIFLSLLILSSNINIVFANGSPKVFGDKEPTLKGTPNLNGELINDEESIVKVTLTPINENNESTKEINRKLTSFLQTIDEYECDNLNSSKLLSPNILQKIFLKDQ